MTLLRERGAFGQFSYLSGLELDPEDAGRLDVVDATITQTGFFVEATTGEARLLNEGDPTPAGVWIAQRDLDTLRQGMPNLEEPHGFGEGFGTQGPQLGGDRSYPEEDSGGTRRVAHREDEPDSSELRPATDGFLSTTTTTTQTQATGTGTDGGGS
jgi:hypothetical protein